MIFCLVLLLLPGLAGARRVEEANKTFSVEIPDNWIYTARDKAWQNKDNSAAMVLNSRPLKPGDKLEAWAADRAKRQGPMTTISKEKLGGQPARRLEFVIQGADKSSYKTFFWITFKGKTAGIMTLVYNKNCRDNIPAIKKKLVSSYKWK